MWLGWAASGRHVTAPHCSRYATVSMCAQVYAEVAVRAEQVAGELGASTVDGFRTLAARQDIDAVLVLNSEWYGPLPVLAACESGKAVYCRSGSGYRASTGPRD